MREKLVAVMLACASAQASAQYNPSAAVNAPKERVVERYKDDKTGEERTRTIEREVAKDQWGNATGNKYDLAVDGAFDGQTVAVLHFYTGEGFDFSLPKAALKEKGFNVVRWLNNPPTPKELASSLKKSNQLWVISDCFSRHLTDEHVAEIKKFFDAGHGVYIWGDNEPYYADANYLGEALLGATMKGDLRGDQVVTLMKEPGKHGLLRKHLLTTGLEFLYEGITIATIQPSPTQMLSPLLYGSADNLVAAFYDKDGRRAIFDGGFTRLYNKWDTAGTARYVKNAAAWLANAERFPVKLATP